MRLPEWSIRGVVCRECGQPFVMCPRADLSGCSLVAGVAAYGWLVVWLAIKRFAMGCVWVSEIFLGSGWGRGPESRGCGQRP